MFNWFRKRPELPKTYEGNGATYRIHKELGEIYYNLHQYDPNFFGAGIGRWCYKALDRDFYRLEKQLKDFLKFTPVYYNAKGEYQTKES